MENVGGLLCYACMWVMKSWLQSLFMLAAGNKLLSISSEDKPSNAFLVVSQHFFFFFPPSSRCGVTCDVMALLQQ